MTAVKLTAFKRYVDESGIKRRDLAQLLGVKESWVSRLYRGKSLPTLEQAQKIFEWSKGEVGLMDWGMPL